MPGPISRIEGMKDATAALRKLSDYAQKQIGKNALKAAADVLTPRVKARAKVSGRAGDPTRGSLKASIRDKPGRKKKGVETRVIIAEDVAAVAKEYGLTRRDYPAEPFFRPAVDSGRRVAGEALAQSIKDDVEHGPWR
jgi:HK97 gp10 family phage protein